MKVKELIEQLSQFDGDMEVRIANIAVSDHDGNLPTYEVLEASKEKNICLIDFEDSLYIDEVYVAF